MVISLRNIPETLDKTFEEESAAEGEHNYSVQINGFFPILAFLLDAHLLPHFLGGVAVARSNILDVVHRSRTTSTAGENVRHRSILLPIWIFSLLHRAGAIASFKSKSGLNILKHN